MVNQILSVAQVSLYGQTFDVSLNWIGNLIRLLITGVGSVGVGIILFSLILRCLVLPFDVFQRISMRKQNQKMEENKERMEKLQKQYANNKDMYNQKVMEMYKENGISLFSSCLPMILSMVIFIVAINAFTDEIVSGKIANLLYDMRHIVRQKHKSRRIHCDIVWIYFSHFFTLFILLTWYITTGQTLS